MSAEHTEAEWEEAMRECGCLTQPSDPSIDPRCRFHQWIREQWDEDESDE